LPQLSIIVPCHNRTDLLRLCLSSVTRHAPPGTQMLVVDDASPAGAASAVAAEFPGVSALRLDRQHGFCAAVNAGLRHATAPVVEVLNDDTEVTAGWTGAALANFADPSVGAVAPLVLCGPPGSERVPRVDSAGDAYALGGVARKRGHGELLGPGHLEPRWVFGASGSSAFYRRDALCAAGGFPEEFGAYFDDVDLSFRLHRAGYRVFYEPAARVWHRVNASHGRPAGALLAQQSRNEELVFWRNLPAPDLLRALPWHLAVLIAKAVRRAGAGELGPFVRGRLEAWAGWRTVLRHRRGLPPARRRANDWSVEPRLVPVSG
jgi:GT2 family glycosyltransferase